MEHDIPEASMKEEPTIDDSVWSNNNEIKQPIWNLMAQQNTPKPRYMHSLTAAAPYLVLFVS